MRYLGNLFGYSANPVQRQALRQQQTDILRIRGTAQIPPPPREVTVQSAPRGIFLSWSEPDPRDENARFIAGWRIYKDDDRTLYEEIRDRATRQKFIEATAGSAPPTTNVFVSSINALGKESASVQAQGAAIAETGAPTMPASPAEYTTTYSGGGDRNSGYGKYQTA